MTLFSHDKGKISPATDGQIKFVFEYIAARSNDIVDGRPNDRRGNEKPDKFLVHWDSPLKGFFRKHIPKESNYDDFNVRVDFSRKEIEICTWSESHHNGDHFGERMYQLKWEVLQEFFPVLKSKMVEVVLKENEEREEKKKRFDAQLQVENIVENWS